MEINQCVGCTREFFTKRNARKFDFHTGVDVVRRAAFAPRHGADGEDGVGGEEVLLLDGVAKLVDDQRVRDEVDVLASLRHIGLARRVQMHRPQDSLPAPGLLSPKESHRSGFGE